MVIFAPMNDVFGTAVLDYQKGNYLQDILVSSPTMEDDILSVPYLFRSYSQMPKIEQKALNSCRGKVLDIGCGAGSHSLHLQQKGLDVTALDNSPGAIQCCKSRGIRQTILSDILSFKDQKFETILLLMNGIGLAGTFREIPNFLHHLKSLLIPDGQIILDSSDLRYLFESTEDGGLILPEQTAYYGEVQFELQYQQYRQKINWVYLDPDNLAGISQQIGFKTNIITQGEHYDYLAKLEINHHLY
ncbi:MAG: class I SAM-dependent methyltransferase [Flavobacteriaceae bacterium]|nr:class I SAM-dependent methyltransferase [Flavobacteriaceae bacterium]